MSKQQKQYKCNQKKGNTYKIKRQETKWSGVQNTNKITEARSN